MRLADARLRQIVRESLENQIYQISIKPADEERLRKVITFLLEGILQDLRQKPAVIDYGRKIGVASENPFDEWSARDAARQEIDTESGGYRAIMSSCGLVWRRWCEQIGEEVPIAAFEKYMQNMILRAALGRERDPAGAILEQLVDSFRYAALRP